MSELEREEMKAFREEMKAINEIISTHCLTRLRNGEEMVCVTDKIPGEFAIKTLLKFHKKGWILSEDYNQNLDTIAEWKRLKTYISDWKDTIEMLEDLVAGSQEDIALIESGDLDEKMLPVYKENLEKWQESLSTKKPQLKKAKIEFKSLKVSIKSLQDKFGQYISQLEGEQ